MSKMSRSGMSCVSASRLTEVPNLPGVRRSVAASSPAIWKQYKSEQKPEPVEEQNSLISFFDSVEFPNASIFPPNGNAFNDISGRYSLRSQNQDRLNHSRSLPFCRPDTAPSFVFDNVKVCRFTAFFSEAISDHGNEHDRSRRVEISVFLEDCTIEIVEPRVEDSGLVQGKLLKRHQVPKPVVGRRSDQGIYGINDFVAGAVLNIYNVFYTIIDCDERTYNHLQSIGQPFGLSSGFPNNCRTGRRPPPRTSRGAPSGGITSRTAAAAGFFEYDRKVLRFYCIWDNRSMLFGDRLQVRLHYYLADNTMEICQVTTRNNGRDTLPKFLKKIKVPYMTQEEVRRPVTADSLSSISTTDPEDLHEGQRYYHWSDLHIGDTVRIASIDVKILDADGFTREFAQSRGCPLADSIATQNHVDGDVMHVRSSTGCSFGGSSATSHGGDVDVLRVSTAGSTFSNNNQDDESFDGINLAISPICNPDANGQPAVPQVMDKHPKLGPPFSSEEIRTAFNNQHGNDVRRVVLRFVSKILNAAAGDEKRSFIIQIHLEDNTLQIREPPCRNSGYKGGVFLRRTRMIAENGVKFMPEDVYLGCTLKILAHQFQVTDADEHTLHFMESNERSWQYSSPIYLKRKMLGVEDTIRRVMLVSPNLNNKFVDREAMRQFIVKSSGLELNLQELVTLFRALDALKTGKVKLTTMLKFLQIPEDRDI